MNKKIFGLPVCYCNGISNVICFNEPYLLSASLTSNMYAFVPSIVPFTVTNGWPSMVYKNCTTHKPVGYDTNHVVHQHEWK